MQRILHYATLLVFATWSANGAEVRLKSEAVCTGAIVRLKDVAEIVSDDEKEAAALAELQLFPVPSLGKDRNVRRGEIRELLALSDVNLKTVALSGAEKLVIRRAGTASSSKAESLAQPIIPTAFVTPTTKLPRSGESVGVELVPVAVRSLDRGTILRATDFELRSAPIPKGESPMPLKIEALVGKELLRPLLAEQQVFREFVQAPRLVRRNDKVRINAVAAGVLVSTDGKALEDGSHGENIQVEDVSTKQKLVTRVTGYGVVEVLGTGVKAVRRAGMN